MNWLLSRLKEPSTQAALSSLFTLTAALTGIPQIGVVWGVVSAAGQAYTQTGSKAAALGAVVTGALAVIMKEKPKT